MQNTGPKWQIDYQCARRERPLNLKYSRFGKTLSDCPANCHGWQIKSGNNLFHALLNLGMNDFSSPQFEQILIFFSPSSSPAVRIHEPVRKVWEFPFLLQTPSVSGSVTAAAEFSPWSLDDARFLLFVPRSSAFVARFPFFVLPSRTTTINFSSSQNCILQTKWEWQRQAGGRNKTGTRTQKFALYSFPSAHKMLSFCRGQRSVPIHGSFSILDSGFRVPIPHFVFINQLSNLSTTNERNARPNAVVREAWEGNPICSLAARVALCTNLRPHRLTVATSSDKLSTQQQDGSRTHQHHRRLVCIIYAPWIESRLTRRMRDGWSITHLQLRWRIQRQTQLAGVSFHLRQLFATGYSFATSTVVVTTRVKLSSSNRETIVWFCY